jgi:hypothetical protein
LPFSHKFVSGCELNLEALSYPAVFLLSATSIGILVVQPWRWAIVLLGIQYTGVFILSTLSWPLQLVLVKLIAGWITALVLWMAQSGLQSSLANHEDRSVEMAIPLTRSHYTGWIFRFFAATIVVVVAISVSPTIKQWLPQLSEAQILGSVVLIGLGLLHLGLTSNPFWVILGLLTALSGFEIIYAGVEISALVQGLLAGVTLGLGLIGAYMILSPTMEPAE